jgi:alpha-tubulin suppressor-like RCC1 family protein
MLKKSPPIMKNKLLILIILLLVVVAASLGFYKFFYKASSIPKFTVINDGTYSSCGLDAKGQAYCWENFDDNGIEIDVAKPNAAVYIKQIKQPINVKFVTISVGSTHTCALTQSGQAYCWGSNISGELGNETSSLDFFKPSLVKQPSGVQFTFISAGSLNACALDKNAQAYCWGENDYGQLGSGNLTCRDKCKPTLVQQSSNMKFKKISVGYENVCALDQTGKIYCWGNNFSGQLGTGNTKSYSIPMPIKISPKIRFVDIEAADQYCGTTDSGQLYCWGLGNKNAKNTIGTKGDATLPKLITESSANTTFE